MATIRCVCGYETKNWNHLVLGEVIEKELYPGTFQKFQTRSISCYACGKQETVEAPVTYIYKKESE